MNHIYCVEIYYYVANVIDSQMNSTFVIPQTNIYENICYTKIRSLYVGFKNALSNVSSDNTVLFPFSTNSLPPHSNLYFIEDGFPIQY